MPDYEAQFRAWATVIQELEADLARLEAGGEALDGRLISADWSTPNLGPMPAEFAQTVVRLVDAQRAALARLAEQQRIVGDQLAAARAAESIRERRGALYLDLES